MLNWFLTSQDEVSTDVSQSKARFVTVLFYCGTAFVGIEVFFVK